jgi:Fic family protein
MAFIRKVKDYYVLVHSIRKNDKIIHKTKYLGKKLPEKKELEIIKKTFLEKIKDNKYKYLSLSEIKEIESKKKEFNKVIKKLSSIEKEKYTQNFMIRFTYDSSKLSGVNITLRQTYLILKDGIIPKDFKNLKTIKEIENHEKGFVAITKYKGNFSLDFIKKIHKILFLGVDNEIAGKLRSELKRNVKIGGTVYVPPTWDKIEKELELFFKWYKSENRKLHPIELAALIHLKLISLQPFADGNSRLSRLLMNWVLWKKNYPLIDIRIEDLEDYYDVLDKYQIEKNEKPFVKYVQNKYIETEYE